MLKEFRVHTPNLIKEVMKNRGTEVLRIPLDTLRRLLVKVGERSAQLNDEELNRLMMQLTIYAAADPEDAAYDPELVKKYLE